MPQAPLAAVKALFFDVFGTLVDWRTGIAREAARIVESRGHAVDAPAFADAWRDEYQPAMDEVRAGRIGYCKLDVLHRRNLERILPPFGIAGLDEGVLHDLTLAWHRLDAWPDVPPGLARLRETFLLAPVSNGNISLMVDLARRNHLPWDAVLGAVSDRPGLVGAQDPQHRGRVHNRAPGLVFGENQILQLGAQRRRGAQCVSGKARRHGTGRRIH